MWCSTKALVALSVLATITPAIAQTTAFDGTYAGVSNTVSGDSCPAKGVSVPPALTIRGGVAHFGTWRDGTVSAQGSFYVWDPQRGKIEAQIDNQGNARGTNVGNACSAVVIWRKSGR